MGCNNSKVEAATVTKSNNTDDLKSNGKTINNHQDDLDILNYNLHRGNNILFVLNDGYYNL
jgi:hypothetical protein